MHAQKNSVFLANTPNLGKVLTSYGRISHSVAFADNQLVLQNDIYQPMQN